MVLLPFLFFPSTQNWKTGMQQSTAVGSIRFRTSQKQSFLVKASANRGFHKCRYPNSWMVYYGQSIYKMIWGDLHFRKSPQSLETTRSKPHVDDQFQNVPDDQATSNRRNHLLETFLVEQFVSGDLPAVPVSNRARSGNMVTSGYSSAAEYDIAGITDTWISSQLPALGVQTHRIPCFFPNAGSIQRFRHLRRICPQNIR